VINLTDAQRISGAKAFENQACPSCASQWLCGQWCQRRDRTSRHWKL